MLWRGFGYDSYGNKTSETNELGQVSTFAFNALRQMTNSVDPLGRITY